MKSVSAYLCVFVLLFLGCKNNRLDIDISCTEQPLEFHRMDKSLFGENAKDMPLLIKDLKKEYGDFYYEFMNNVMNITAYSDSVAATELNYFVYNSDMNAVNKYIEKSFTNIESIEAELSKAFCRYRHYFPADTLPEIVFCHSGYNVGIYPSKKYLGISLEWYLGYENEIIQRLPNSLIPNFFKKRMDKKFLVTDAVKGFLTVKNYRDLSDKTFLDNMIHEGKIMYLTEAMLPQNPDSILMVYSLQQHNWMKFNEYSVWKKLVDDEVLFKKGQQQSLTYLQDGPFTNGLSRDSAPRAGVWIGWQIVRAYMNENPQVSLNELIRETDSRKILKFYKPNKG